MISLTNVDSSTVSWIELLPIGWQLTRLKWTTNQIKNGIWGDEPKKSDDDVICVRVADFDRIAFRVILDKPTLRNVPHSQQHGRLLKSGDLLIEKSGGGELQPVGTVVIYDRHDPAVCSNFIARVEIRDGYDPRFLTYLHAHLYAIRVNTRSIKQTTGIQNLDSQSYFDEFVGIPPWQTQKSIARFLDRKTAAIDTLIAKKQRLIQLLEEKRTALINQAVTKGLNPNAPMKDSGIPWIGEIPKHWEVVRVKTVINFITSGSRGWAEYYTDNEKDPIFLQSGNLGNQMQLRLEGVQHARPPKGSEGERAIVKQGDILVCMTGARTGNIAVVQEILSEAYINQHLSIVRPITSRINSCFLGYSLKSKTSFSQFLMSQYGGTKQGLGLEDVKDTFLVYPPLTEQRKIVDFLDARNLKTNDAIRKLEIQIEKLQEYRRSLITAAVTGKLDIQEVDHAS